MSKIGVSFKIDVSKIDKARLFKGAKGTYLDITSFIDLDQLDQYGNSGMITQDVSKEEKDQGVKGPILGNCKVFWSDSGATPQQPAAHNQQQQYAPQQPAQGGFQQQTPTQGGFQQQPTQGTYPPTGATPPVPANGFDDFDDDVIF